VEIGFFGAFFLVIFFLFLFPLFLFIFKHFFRGRLFGRGGNLGTGFGGGDGWVGVIWGFYIYFENFSI
jgi:hypothetical protein